MATTVTTSNLKVNVMKRSQYDEITPSNNELYFVEYDDTTIFLKSVSSTPPQNPSNGDLYYNTTTKLIYTYSTADEDWVDGSTPSKNTFYVDTSDRLLWIYDGTSLIRVGGTPTADNVDNVTTALDNNNNIKAIGVIEKNAGNAVYDWVGTKQEYEQLGTYNNNWLYYITDDNQSAGNMSMANVFARLNAAWAWMNNGTVVYTVPSPVAGFKTYSNAENMTESSVILSTSGDDTSITDGTTTYTRDVADDTVFGGISNDSKNQFLTVYDLLKAIQG